MTAGIGRQIGLPRGRNGGRPAKLTGERLKMAANLLQEGHSVSSVARIMDVSRATLHRSINTYLESDDSNAEQVPHIRAAATVPVTLAIHMGADGPCLEIDDSFYILTDEQVRYIAMNMAFFTEMKEKPMLSDCRADPPAIDVSDFEFV